MFTIKNLPDSKVKIDAEIATDEFDRFFQETLKEIKKDFEAPGFRKGMVPENTVIQKFGEEKILSQAAERVISAHWAHILAEAKVEPVGYPEIVITKIAKGNPLGFSITVAVIGLVVLPDYKTLAQKILVQKEEIAVTDEEITQAIEYLKKAQEKKELSPYAETIAKMDPNDSSLKEIIRQNIRFEKEMKTKEKKRMEILEAMAKELTVTIPTEAIDTELEKMLGELERSVTDMGIPWQQYLDHIKKTIDDLKKEWQDQAKNRVKFGLILREIARAEKLVPEKTKVTERAQEMLKQLSEDDRKKTSLESIERYLSDRMQHEMVFDLLEKNINKE